MGDHVPVPVPCLSPSGLTNPHTSPHLKAGQGAGHQPCASEPLSSQRSTEPGQSQGAHQSTSKSQLEVKRERERERRHETESKCTSERPALSTGS